MVQSEINKYNSPIRWTSYFMAGVTRQCFTLNVQYYNFLHKTVMKVMLLFYFVYQDLTHSRHLKNCF
jgi:hypothetical protein